jgi:hypothetical protein
LRLEAIGLHAIISRVNQHISQSALDGGILEFDVSDDSLEFVHQHIDQTTYEVPDGSYIIATKRQRRDSRFKPNGNEEKSSLALKSLFLKASDSSVLSNRSVAGDADFIACLPLTRNPTIKLIKLWGGRLRLLHPMYNPANAKIS